MASYHIVWHRELTYCVRGFMPDIYILGPKAAYKSLFLLDSPKREAFDPTRRVLLPLILSSEAFCHAMLAAASAHRLRLLPREGNSSGVGFTYESSLLFHKIETYRRVNQILMHEKQVITETAIGAVLYLVATEVRTHSHFSIWAIPRFLFYPVSVEFILTNFATSPLRKYSR
jgi:hypothetical protein